MYITASIVISLYNCQGSVNGEAADITGEYAMAFQATVGETHIQWRDTKRYLWIVGAIIPLIPFAAWGLVSWTGEDFLWYFGPFFVFVVIPIAAIRHCARSRNRRSCPPVMPA